MATQKRAKASSTLELKAAMLHWLYTANYFPLSLFIQVYRNTDYQNIENVDKSPI